MLKKLIDFYKLMYHNKPSQYFYTFGSLKNGRNFSVGSGYRFGFNGKEKDGESFEGCVAFEARIFDSRIGKFLSTDPMKSSYPWQTPYAYFANSPISQLDILGMGGPYQEESESKTSNEGNSSGKQGNTFSDLIKLPPEPKQPDNTIAEWKSENRVKRSGKSKSEFKEAKIRYKNELQKMKTKWEVYKTEVEYRSELSSAIRTIEKSSKPSYIIIREQVESANISIPLYWGTISDENHIGEFSYEANIAEGKINFCSITIDLAKLGKNNRTEASIFYDEHFAFPNTITYASTITVLVHELGGHFLFTFMKVSQHMNPDKSASEAAAIKIEKEAFLYGDGKN